MQLRCKNKKLKYLAASKSKKLDNYKIPVTNLSTENLDMKQLKYGLNHSHIDKKKYVKRNVAVELESLTINLEQSIKPPSKKIVMNI